jgi:hypothetical protein
MSKIDELFREKRRTAKPVIVKKEKKIKKKDLPVLKVADLELKQYEYDLVDDIKIYNGIIPEKKEEKNQMIELCRKIRLQNPFTKLMPSVLSVQGGFENILFNEEKEMPFKHLPPRNFADIVKIGSNFGEIYLFPNKYAPHSIRKMITSVFELKAQNLVIGCHCQDPLDISLVYKLLQELENDSVFKEFSSRLTSDLLESHGLKKTSITKFLKHFRLFTSYCLTDRDKIKDIQSTLSVIAPKEYRVQVDEHINKTIDMLRVFTQYGRRCKCYKNTKDFTLFAPSVKVKTKKIKNTGRKKQGTGLYFSSQVTFDIYNETNNKISKIKLFRNGNFQVPGVKCPDMRDLIAPTKRIAEYWNYVHKQEKPARIDYFLSNMRNYKCNIAGNVTVLLNQLEDVLYTEKELPVLPNPAEWLPILKKLRLEKYAPSIFRYMNTSLFEIGEISNNSERYPGILIKFNRPIPSKKNKKLTIKILGSGKINFDGGNSGLEIKELYYWLQYIFSKYWNEIVYDPNNCKDEYTSPDEYESIYDDSE